MRSARKRIYAHARPPAARRADRPRARDYPPKTSGCGANAPESSRSEAGIRPDTPPPQT